MHFILVSIQTNYCLFDHIDITAKTATLPARLQAKQKMRRRYWDFAMDVEYDQCCRFSRNIAYVTPNNIFFHCKEIRV